VTARAKKPPNMLGISMATLYRKIEPKKSKTARI